MRQLSSPRRVNKSDLDGSVDPRHREAAARTHASGADATTALSPRGRACVARQFARDYAAVERLAAGVGDLADVTARGRRG